MFPTIRMAKAIVARENSDICIRRKEDPRRGIFWTVILDITIPYDELGSIDSDQMC